MTHCLKGGPCILHLTDFLPTTRFDENELELVISRMSTLNMGQQNKLVFNFKIYLVRVFNVFRPDTQSPPPPCESIQRMSCQHPDYTIFQQLLRQGRPIVVYDVHRRLQGTWNPSYFMEQFGSQEVKLVDCMTDTEFTSTVADFFKQFGTAEGHGRTIKLKVCQQAMT